jgi:hypothetical protein
MDGKTSMVARAVDTAFYRKNMLVVAAAGNDGLDPDWKVLSTPGDARGAFTVGATKLKIWEKMDFSSVGTPGLDYLKPNISCFATMGTSFSTPIITGLAAAIMQYDSTLSAQEIRTIIEKAGSYYPYGNDYVGYGVPRSSIVLKILQDRTFVTQQPARYESTKNKLKIPIPFENNYIVVFHKKDRFHVIRREVIRGESPGVLIKKWESARQSTVLIDNRVYEIFWH